MDRIQTGMNHERDSTSGRFAAKYDEEEFLVALDEVGPASTSDVAEAVGCPQRTAYHHLDGLRDDGRITSQQVGGAMLWSRAEVPA